MSTKVVLCTPKRCYIPESFVLTPQSGAMAPRAKWCYVSLSKVVVSPPKQSGVMSQKPLLTQHAKLDNMLHKNYNIMIKIYTLAPSLLIRHIVNHVPDDFALKSPQSPLSLLAPFYICFRISKVTFLIYRRNRHVLSLTASASISGASLNARIILFKTIVTASEMFIKKP